MQKPQVAVPHHRDYIQENWLLCKSKSTSEMKKIIASNCLPLSEEEAQGFTKWFNNQKTIESKKNKRHQTKNLFNQSTCHTTPSEYSFQEMSELTFEEKKQDQNLELFFNDENQLVQSLLQWTTQDEKLDFLRTQLQNNFLVLTKFMRTRREAPQGFLELITSLCKEEDQIISQHQQTLLFLRVCALHQKEMLEVTNELTQNAFIELANDTTDESAAYGLLKLAYLNDISFEKYPLASLNRFQERYKLPLKRFLLYLEGPVDYKPLKCLPLTCFIFTHPFYNLLKDSGAKLHQNIEPDYQMQFVELLAYSFEGSEENVINFIEIFTAGCIEISGRNIYLLSLLEKLIIKEQKQERLFFGSLKNQILLFEHLFAQLREHGIMRLEEAIIDSLLLMNPEQYCNQNRQPRIIGTNEEIQNSLKAYWQEFIEMNPRKNFDQFLLPSVCSKFTEIASIFGIHSLNPSQIFAFALTKQHFRFQRLFQQLPTGTGKTTFSLVWMLYAWSQFQIPSIANYASIELCQYDYERLVNVAGSLDLSILLVSNNEQLASWGDYSIVFTTTPLLKTLAQDPEKLNMLTKRQLVLDEFDASFFDSDQIAEDAKLFLQFKYLVAFTGSPLEAVHINILTKHLYGLLLQYPSLGGLRGQSNVCHQVEVFSKREQQYKKIVDICIGQSSHTPLLVILDQAAYTKFLQLSTGRKLLIKNLAQAAPTDVKAFFAASFTTSQNGHFYTALISTSQGRGLDPPTSSAIEKAGGVYVIIGATPSTFRELEQFKGRTARMGGNGQYSVVLWNNKFQGTAESFLKEHLAAQSSKELLTLSGQYINVVAPKLPEAVSNEQQQKENENSPEDVTTSENMDESEDLEESENSGQENQNFNKQEEQDISKQMQTKQKECTAHEKQSSKEDPCKEISAKKERESTTNKTLGKCVRPKNEKYQENQNSKKKRELKQGLKEKNNITNKKKRISNLLPYKQASVRVNKGLKVLIPKDDLQAFRNEEGERRCFNEKLIGVRTH